MGSWGCRPLVGFGGKIDVSAGGVACWGEILLEELGLGRSCVGFSEALSGLRGGGFSLGSGFKPCDVGFDPCSGCMGGFDGLLWFYLFIIILCFFFCCDIVDWMSLGIFAGGGGIGLGRYSVVARVVGDTDCDCTVLVSQLSSN